MKTTTLLSLMILFICTYSSLNAQESYEIKCKMTVEEVLREQPFDIDLAIAENARDLLIELFSELNLVYNQVNENISNDYHNHIEAIRSLIKSSEDLEMNYSMFEKDLEFIETLN